MFADADIIKLYQLLGKAGDALEAMRVQLSQQQVLIESQAAELEALKNPPDAKPKK